MYEILCNDFQLFLIECHYPGGKYLIMERMLFKDRVKLYNKFVIVTWNYRRVKGDIHSIKKSSLAV